VLLGGIIIIGTALAMTVIVIAVALIFWRAGYFKDVEAPKHHMMGDEEDR